MLRNLHPYAVLTLFVIGFQVIGGLMGLFSPGNVDLWYDPLVKSPLNPPGVAFGIAWTILYFLLAVCLWMVWKLPDSQNRRIILTFFGIHMVMNWAWTPLFFSLHAVMSALVLLVALVITAIMLFKMIWPLDRRAAMLLLPYIAWLCFATHLNYYIWAHN
jgi:benzodiazapine receptor